MAEAWMSVQGTLCPPAEQGPSSWVWASLLGPWTASVVETGRRAWVTPTTPAGGEETSSLSLWTAWHRPWQGRAGLGREQAVCRRAGRGVGDSKGQSSRASPFGEIEFVELDRTAERVHPVLALLQDGCLLLSLSLPQASICRGRGWSQG